MLLTFDFEIDPNLENLDGDKSLQAALQSTVKKWHDITTRQFLTGRDPEGRTWTRLAPSTLKSKEGERYSRAVGRSTGEAFYQSRFVRPTADGFEMGFRAPYMQRFHEGADNQPARPIYILDKSQELSDKHAEEILKEFDKEMS